LDPDVGVQVAAEWTQVVTVHQEAAARRTLHAARRTPPAACRPHAPRRAALQQTQLSSFSAFSLTAGRTGLPPTSLRPHRHKRGACRRVGTELRAADPAGRPALRHGRSPQSARAAAGWRETRRARVNSKGHVGGHVGGQCSGVVRLEWPATGRFLGPVCGRGAGEPTLPAPLPGRCGCKCQGDVPTQAGEPAAPVPERSTR